MANPKSTADVVYVVSPEKDAVHFKDQAGNVLAWIDQAGVLQGALVPAADVNAADDDAVAFVTALPEVGTEGQQVWLEDNTTWPNGIFIWHSGLWRPLATRLSPQLSLVGPPSVFTLYMDEMGNGSSVDVSGASVLNIPVLSGVSGAGVNLTVHDSPGLTALVLPIVTMSGARSGLRVTCNSGLTSLSLAALTDISGAGTSLGVDINDTLASVSFAALTDISGSGTININTNAALTTLSFPVLVDLSGAGASLNFDTNTLLDTVSLAALANISGAGANVIVTNSAALTTLSLPALAAITGTTVAFTFSGNALNAASVNGILAKLLATGATGNTLDISGGTNAAPSGQGITDAAALVTAGWTVVTN